MKRFLVVFLIFFLFAFSKQTFASTQDERGRQMFEWIISHVSIPPSGVKEATAMAPVYIHLYLDRDVAGANYFLENTSPWGDEDEDFPASALFRIYFDFKDSPNLTQKAKEHLLNRVIGYWADRCYSTGAWTDCCNDSRCDVYNSENHNIIKYSLYYLARETFGKRTDLAEQGIDRWIDDKVKHGMTELNSPTYTDRSLMGLLLLYDFAKNQRVKTKAKMALDQLFAATAAINLYQSRCGPAMRVYPENAYDKSLDGMYDAGYILFGHGGFPSRYHMSTIQVVGTSYRLPKVISDLATQTDQRGSYVLKGRGAAERRDAYYFISPSFVLGAFQGLEYPSVPQQTQIWSACFKNSPKTMILSNNAFMQYKNTIIFDSRYNYYSFGLEETGDSGWTFLKGTGAYVAQKKGLFSYSDTSQRVVSLMEIRESKDFSSFEEFKNKIKNTPLTVSGRSVTYTNTFGETIFYNTQTNEAKVNGQNFSLNDYPLFESPYLNSAFESGIIDIQYKQQNCHLDFRNLANPVFTGCESGNCPDWERGNLNCDSKINDVDLGLLLNQWGTASNADLNLDGQANEKDLTLLLSNWKN